MYIEYSFGDLIVNLLKARVDQDFLPPGKIGGV